MITIARGLAVASEHRTARCVRFLSFSGSLDSFSRPVFCFSCHKPVPAQFFVVFLFWSTLYLLYTLSLLIAAIASRAAIAGPVPLSSSSLDPNLLALLVTTVLFCTFSGGMLAMHVHLLRRNASTVEWRGVQDIRERERAVISQVVPVCACLGMGEGERGNGGLLGQKEERGWADDELVEVQKALPKGFKGRRALRRQWDAEWGRIGKEGNLWWLGSDLENWESVMGKNAWTWFCESTSWFSRLALRL